jgi:hypothetical protein
VNSEKLDHPDCPFCDGADEDVDHLLQPALGSKGSTSISSMPPPNPLSGVRDAGFAKPVGTGSVRPVPGGTGPARYTTGPVPTSKPCLIFLTLNERVSLTGLPTVFF